LAWLATAAGSLGHGLLPLALGYQSLVGVGCHWPLVGWVGCGIGHWLPGHTGHTVNIGSLATTITILVINVSQVTVIIMVVINNVGIGHWSLVIVSQYTVIMPASLGQYRWSRVTLLATMSLATNNNGWPVITAGHHGHTGQ